MKTAFAKPTHRSQFYTKFATPLVLESPRHSGLGTILLSRGKHLLGTSGDCTVSLRAGDVQPRHALIVVSEHRTVVKALDPRTWVNDGPVSEMALRPGDRLSIGPLTFRVRAADADELASLEEIPEQTIPEDVLLESVPVAEPPAKAVAHREPVRELPLPTVTDPVAAKTNSPTMPLPAPVAAPLVPLRLVATTSHGNEIKTVVPAAEIKFVPPPLPTSAASVASALSLLPPPASTLNPPEYTETHQREVSAAEAAVTATLDHKLDEIQRTLTELQLPMEQTSSTPSFNTALPADALAAERRQYGVRQDELQKRADELARQSQLLHERVARVAEREVEVERSLSRLAVEHEQLAATAEVTRKQLDEEYARHMALWQEWDAAYRRTSGELNGQLQSMEQRRTALLAEGDRLASDRSELQRLQAEHERDRRIHAAERVQLTTDRAALQTLRAEFDTERQQHLVAVQEREARVAAERSAVSATQGELLATRQQLERERSEFLTVRSTEALRHEQELHEHVERREQLDLDHAQVQARTLNLNELERVLEAERKTLAAQREEFATQQSDIAADRTELSQLRDRLRTTAARLLQLQTERGQSALATTIAGASSDVRSESTPDWIAQPYLNAPVPPPIPTDWREESPSAVQVTEGSIVELSVTAATSFTEGWPVPRGAVLPSEMSNGPVAPPVDSVSAVSEGGHSPIEIARGERETFSAAAIPVRELAPAAAATVHRFWEDNTLYDTSREEPSQPYTPTHSTASSNLMSADSKPPTDCANVENDGLEPAIDELLADLAGGDTAASSRSENVVDPEPAMEFESSFTTATALAEPPLNADETLCEINRQFGVPVAPPQDTRAETAKPALPSWWIETAPTAASELPIDAATSAAEIDLSELPSGHADLSDHEPPQSQNSELPPTTSTEETAAADPLLSLRAELARMFDLKATEADSNATENPTDENAVGVDETAAANDSDVLHLTLTPGSEGVDHALSDNTESVAVTESEPPPLPNSGDEVASNDSRSATATEIVAETTTPETNVEEESAEDSMETYLAQLLSRTRGTDVSEHEVKSLTAKPSGATAKSSDSSRGDEDKPVAKFDPADRSHLTAEPKHKQDRQAAREDLQQFRQVAHQSARSALARHTSKALLSAVIAKSMLLGISVTAVCVYVGAPLMGIATPAWKGVACTFTTGLCIMEFHRSWRQLRSWRTTGKLPAGPASTTKIAAAPSGELTVVATQPETKSESSAIG